MRRIRKKKVGIQKARETSDQALTSRVRYRPRSPPKKAMRQTARLVGDVDANQKLCQPAPRRAILLRFTSPVA